MAKAVWNGIVIAESDQTVVVEETHYFPADSIQRHYFKPSGTSTSCPTKGQASYYHLEVNGRINMDAAWYYPDPPSAVAQIKGHVAFWRGVQIEVDGKVKSPASAETPAAPKAKAPAPAPAKASTPVDGGGEKTTAPIAKTDAPAGDVTPPKPKPAPVDQVDKTGGGPGKPTPPVDATPTADQTQKTDAATKATPPTPAVSKAEPEPPQKPAKAAVADSPGLDELRPTG